MGQERPKILGICGMIGSGKSLASEILEGLGCVVISADKLAREILDSNDAREFLLRNFGSEVIGPYGVDRKKLADIIFEDPVKKQLLEDYIHPRVIEEQSRLIKHYKQHSKDRPAIVLDTPLLIEVGINRDCDYVVFIDSPRSLRLKRLYEKRGWQEYELLRRERYMLPAIVKRSIADAIIFNHSTVASLETQLKLLLFKISS